MASLGFPVIAIEPVIEHVNTILGTIYLNPSFHIELHRGGISHSDYKAHVNMHHGGRNWGATIIEEVENNDAMELQLFTLPSIIKHNKIALLKIDCEGCEWSTLLGLKSRIKSIPMIKLEVNKDNYINGNQSVTSQQMLIYLEDQGFELFYDHWPENNLYFGKKHGIELEIDRIFGTSALNLLAPDFELMTQSALKIIEEPFQAKDFDIHAFTRLYSDVIAIERVVSAKMKAFFGVVS
jgi:FkbM family methyltransferase